MEPVTFKYQHVTITKNHSNENEKNNCVLEINEMIQL